MATAHSIFSEALTSAFFDHQVFSPTFAASYAKTFCSATLFFFGLSKLPGDSKARRQEGFSDNSVT